MEYLLLVLLLIGTTSLCLEVIPERAYVTYFDKDYVKWATFRTSRYSRKGKYYFHLDAELIHPWDNNVTVHLIFNEFLHNEYRRSFIEMHFKLCDLIDKEQYVGALFKKAGAVCPLPAGMVHFRNMSVSAQNFPNVFPFEKGRVDGTLNLTSSGLMIGALSLVCTFKQ